MEMEYRRLGNSGLYVSALSFGSWVTFANQVDTAASTEMMATAYDHGVNFFDNAEVYADGQSEEIMGRSLMDLGWSRDTYAVSSKVFWGGKKTMQRGLNRKHIFDACHAALKRLRVDYLDLYFCHRPDIHTPIEETVRAMSDLVSQGKIMYWGTSEWTAAQIAEAHGSARELSLVPPTMEQPEYNLLNRERVEAEYGPLYQRFGLGTTIWSPLASGILSGKYSVGIPEDSRMNLEGFEWLRKKVDSDSGRADVAKAQQLKGLADEMGVSLVHLAIAWCLKNPNVSTVILGASRHSQLLENLGAIEVLSKINDEVVERIETIMQNKPRQVIDLR